MWNVFIVYNLLVSCELFYLLKITIVVFDNCNLCKITLFLLGSERKLSLIAFVIVKYYLLSDLALDCIKRVFSKITICLRHIREASNKSWLAKKAILKYH